MQNFNLWLFSLQSINSEIQLSGKMGQLKSCLHCGYQMQPTSILVYINFSYSFSYERLNEFLYIDSLYQVMAEKRDARLCT